MMPAHIVKICGITTMEDALAAIDAGASAVGFNFWPQSPRCIAPAEAARIGAQLPADVLKVGVFVDATPEHVAAVSCEARLDVAQIHGGAAGTVRCWRAYRVGADGAFAVSNAGGAEAILLDTAVPGLRGGTGHSFPWHVARGLEYRIIIAGGLDAANVRQAIREARPWGVDACSRIETTPGRKDPEKMKAFIAEALAEFA